MRNSVRDPGFIVVSLRCWKGHFTQALKACDFNFAAPCEFFSHELIFMGVILGVQCFCALGDAIKRRHGEEEMSVAHQIWHFLEKERHQQGCDVGTVHVRIGHDDDFVVTQIIAAIFFAGATPKRLRNIGNLLVGGDFVARGASDIENFTAQRQYCLIGAVSRLFGATARRITPLR